MPNNYRELTQKVIEIIADEMDIPAHLILSKARSEEIVGARHMAIMILRNMGLYPKRIAELIGRTPRAVLSALSSFERKLTTDRLLRNIYARATKQLGKTLEISDLPR